jgi:hypothetical protein
MASLSPLACDVLHYSTTPNVISPLICGLNCPVKAAMNTIKGRAFFLRGRPLPPPQRSIPAYKRRPPLPGPLHTLGHHSFALFPRFHELPPATSLPILPRPLRLTLWCVPCSINHRGRFSTLCSPSPDHSSDRRLDEAPPPPRNRDHHRAVSSPDRLDAAHPPVRLETSSPILPLTSSQPTVIPWPLEPNSGRSPVTLPPCSPAVPPTATVAPASFFPAVESKMDAPD